MATPTRKVAVIVGSLRKNSYSSFLARAFTEVAPESLTFQNLEIGDLPFYNEDLETSTPPESWTRLREQIKASDALLFVTPEYNRSIPGVLANAIDVGSRPYGHNAWDKKPGAVISSSISSLGGFGANHHLRQSLVFVNVPTMQQPELYIPNTPERFDNDGNLIDASTRTMLKDAAQAFASWIDRACLR